MDTHRKRPSDATVLFFFRQNHQEEISSIRERINNGQYVEPTDTTRIRKDGTRLDISFTLSPIRDSKGKVVAVSVIARDISERKQREEEIRKLNADLEKRVEERTVELRAANRVAEEANRAEPCGESESAALWGILHRGKDFRRENFQQGIYQSR